MIDHLIRKIVWVSFQANHMCILKCQRACRVSLFNQLFCLFSLAISWWQIISKILKAFLKSLLTLGCYEYEEKSQIHHSPWFFQLSDMPVVFRWLACWIISWCVGGDVPVKVFGASQNYLAVVHIMRHFHGLTAFCWWLVLRRHLCSVEIWGKVDQKEN